MIELKRKKLGEIQVRETEDRGGREKKRRKEVHRRN